MGTLAKLIVIVAILAVIVGTLAFISDGTARREEAKAERIYAQAVLATSQGDAFAVRSQASLPYVMFIGLLGVGVLVFLSRADRSQHQQQPQAPASAPAPQIFVIQAPSQPYGALAEPQDAAYYMPAITVSNDLVLVD